MSRSRATPAVADRSAHWARQMAAVIPRQGWLKAIGIPLYIAVFFVAYFHLLRHPAYPTTPMPITALDRLIGVEPRALAVYLSIWLYVSLPPALLGTRRALCAYGRAIGATCLAGLLAFYFWPTALPASAIDWTASPELAWLKGIDATGNACPSLHVATAAFSAYWLHHLLGRFGAPGWLRLANWIWCAAIAYSTLATRQHVAVDVLAGLALGLLGAALSLRRQAMVREPWRSARANRQET